MKSQRAEQMAGAGLAQIVDRQRDDMALSEPCQGPNSQRYLKCWGVDYPYLEKAQGRENQFLPLAADSAAQGLIRNMSRPFQYK